LFVKDGFAQLALGRFTRARAMSLCAVESFSVARIAGFALFALGTFPTACLSQAVASTFARRRSDAK
jgi:hypothetical protein